MASNQVFVWDFTLPWMRYRGSETDLICTLDKHCKKWAFQLEMSEQGYKHYQGRISLKVKQRLNGVKKIISDSCHWSPTSTANRANMFYVLKEDTRIAGPWTDEMDIVPNYIPRQIRNLDLYPWQQSVIEMSKEWDTRTINVIYDTKGNIGKSTLVTYMGVFKLAHQIPFCNDYKEILQAVMDRPVRKCYLIDMPRAIKKEKQFQLWSAIETVKSGYSYDTRYKYKERYFDCPIIFVFTNHLPDKKLLTPDRWKLWEVDDNALIPYDPDLYADMNEVLLSEFGSEDEQKMQDLEGDTEFLTDDENDFILN